MTTKEALTELFNEANRFPFEKPKYDTYDLLRMSEQIQRDLELLELFLTYFKSTILEASDNQNRRGDNIIADKLRDEFGLITLNKLKERLEDDKRNDTTR